MPMFHGLPGLGMPPTSPVHEPVFERLLAQTTRHDPDFLYFANLALRDDFFVMSAATSATRR